MDENFNTMHACIVHSTDDGNDDARHAPTAFNHASNANIIADTSIALVTFPLLNIRDQREDEDFIGPDGHANPLPEGFSVAPRTTVNVSRHVGTQRCPYSTHHQRLHQHSCSHEYDSRRAIQLTVGRSDTNKGRMLKESHTYEKCPT